MVFLAYIMAVFLLTGCVSTYKSDIVNEELKQNYLYSTSKIVDVYSDVYHLSLSEYLKREKENIKNSVLCMAFSKEIHYCRIFYFDSNVRDKIRNYLHNHKDEKFAFIMDFRHNKGGIFNEAIILADLFMDEKKIVTTFTKDGSVTNYYTRSGDRDFLDIPLVLLADSKTASASEIFVGSLQAHERAVVVGKKTFGKNTIQELIPISSKNLLKLTVEYYEIVGYKKPFKGVIPDILIQDNQFFIKNQKMKKLKCNLNIDKSDITLKIGFCTARNLLFSFSM